MEELKNPKIYKMEQGIAKKSKVNGSPHLKHVRVMEVLVDGSRDSDVVPQFVRWLAISSAE